VPSRRRGGFRRARRAPPNAVPSQRYRRPSGRCPTLTLKSAYTSDAAPLEWQDRLLRAMTACAEIEIEVSADSIEDIAPAVSL
jgi:hypothetical protein